jgi:hypothetical protein
LRRLIEYIAGLDFELSFKIAHQDPVQGYSD